MSSVLIIVIVAVVVLLVLIGIVVAILAARKRQRTEHERREAESLREQAATHAPEVRQREQVAQAAQAEAQAAREEAELQREQAQRLEEQARERQSAAEEIRDEHHDHLRRADELDPTVDTSHEDYDGPDGVHSSADGAEPTTVTHPDGSTERVEVRDEFGSADGTTRA